jgi:hypothetical protein
VAIVLKEGRLEGVVMGLDVASGLEEVRGLCVVYPDGLADTLEERVEETVETLVLDTTALEEP